MKVAEFDINAAEGVYLLSNYRLDNKFYPQGHILTAEDIIFFKLYGIRQVYGAEAEDFDLDKNTSLGMIAAKICGNNTAYVSDDDNVINIVAADDGILLCSQDRLQKFNHLYPDLILNTIAPYQPVKKGEIIAKLELNSPLMNQSTVDEILFKLSGNVSLLQIGLLESLKVGLIYGNLLNNEAETEHFTANVKTLLTSFADYNLDFSKEYQSYWNLKDMSDSIQDAIDDGLNVVFVLGGTSSGSMNGVISGSLRQISDGSLLFNFPQLNASDLFIAQHRQTKIIALPYNYHLADVDYLNNIIKQAIYTKKLTLADFAHLAPIDLSKGEKLTDKLSAKLLSAQPSGTKGKKANIAAIVLAAGIGSRSGRGKLMVPTKDDVPLFMKAVNAAIASDACPVFVITGYQHEQMSEYLDNLDVNVIYNSAYRSGIKTSLDLGLKSVPDFCDGAMILPADMPNLTGADLNKLINSFKKGKDKQISLFAHKGIKSNPIIWSKSLYDKADVVPENTDVRPVFMEHADYTNVVELKDKNKLLDVNFPSDIEKI